MLTSAVDAANFVGKIDKLFDSVNGRVLVHKSKTLLSACTLNSKHHEQWEGSIQLFKSLDKEERKKKFRSVSVWITTFTAFKMITEELLNVLTFILMSCFKQDALANFFSQLEKFEKEDACAEFITTQGSRLLVFY